jgi:hypothetical protein
MSMKRFVGVFVGFFIVSVLYGQDSAAAILRLDNTVKNLALELNGKLASERGGKVAVTQFVYRDFIPQFGSYWATQLIEELTNVPNRSFVLLSGDSADLIISGEIIEMARIVRVYTRLIRSNDRSIVANLHTDLEVDDFVAGMLSDGDAVRPGGSSSSVSRDRYEPDSFDNPLRVEIASNSDAQAVNRTIHGSGDEDFFLLVPDRDGSLTMETTGAMDTVMEFFNADSRSSLAENDDGGSGGNSRIRQTVRAGGRYIAKVRGYSDDEGSYGFRAYSIEQVRIPPDEFESDDSFSSAKEIQTGTPQQHSFTSGDDVDWVTFTVSQPGSYLIRTRGVNSTRLDTYIELYDSNQNIIDENDDGGEDMDSRLSARLERGTYYLKVECLNDEPDQPYTISIETE